MRIARATFMIALALAGTNYAARIAAQSAPASPAPVFSLAEQEQFLLEARIVRTRGAKGGITGTLRATMSDGRTTHDASIQSIDESKQRFEGTQGVEFNFVDSWRYNVAAYRLDRLLDLGMIPPSVERTYNGKKAAFTWWVDDVLMDEAVRLRKKVQAPDPKRWNEQMWHVRMFDQLIYNVDRNLGNLLIDTDWRIWMIDHSRAFRLMPKPKSERALSRIDRSVLERLKALDRPTLVATMKNYLTVPEINALLARRDVIVKHFEQADARIFDWQRPARP